jgi:hypothetical protein
MQQKYLEHLKNLQLFFQNEIEKSNLKATVTNLSVLPDYQNEMTIHIDSEIKVNQNYSIPVRMKVYQKFPGEPPKLFLLKPVKHALVLPDTLEIQYKNYYPWTDNGKISEIFK